MEIKSARGMMSASKPTGVMPAGLRVSRRNLLKGAAGGLAVALTPLGGRSVRADFAGEETLVIKETHFTSPDGDTSISVLTFDDPSPLLDELEKNLRDTGQLTPEMEAELSDLRAMPRVAVAGGNGLLDEKGLPRVSFSSFGAVNFSVDTPSGLIAGFDASQVFLSKQDGSLVRTASFEDSKEAAQLWLGSGGQDALLQFAAGFEQALRNAESEGFDVFPPEPRCLALFGENPVGFVICTLNFVNQVNTDLQRLTACMSGCRRLIRPLRPACERLCRRRFAISLAGRVIQLIL